jgi:hypothetical protein
VNQRGAAEQVDPSELTERAAGMLESALAAGDSQGIAEAVFLFDEVMSVCSRGPHVEYWKSVVNLGDALIKQAEADGSDGPVDRALDLLDANEQHFRTRDQQVRFLQRRGHALLLKAQRTADRAVMRAAVQARRKRAGLTPRGHEGYGEGMLELGVTLLYSGAMFRNVAELDEAVAVLEAAEKHPDGSADRSLVLSSLGNARLERLLRSAGCSWAGLDVVVADHLEAMHECAPGSANVLDIESDCGSAFFRVYELTRDREYLDLSVGPVRRRCRISCHPMRPGHIRGSDCRAGPAAEPGHSDPWWAGPHARRAALAERPVPTMAVVMIDVLAQDQPQVPFAGDQHPVQALSPGAGNPPLRDRVRTRRQGRSPDDPHADCGEHRVEDGGELSGWIH